MGSKKSMGEEIFGKDDSAGETAVKAPYRAAVKSVDKLVPGVVPIVKKGMKTLHENLERAKKGTSSDQGGYVHTRTVDSKSVKKK